jgi:DNA invertase Pin-like site-specific DNA recombinase
MANGKFVSYLRVSTARQGVSGLGLEAQRAAVQAHLNGGNWKIVDEVIEVESGKDDDRPELAKALRLCRLHGASLLVAKLDRLSRDVAFLSNLMKSTVKFTAADMPEADETHLHMMAVFAHHEARMISTRTKAALAQSKKKLGGRRVSAKRFAEIAAEGRKASVAVRSEKADAWASDVRGIIADIQAGGVKSLRDIAGGLNERGIATRRGGEWSAVQVSRVMDRTS